MEIHTVPFLTQPPMWNTNTADARAQATVFGKRSCKALARLGSARLGRAGLLMWVSVSNARVFPAKHTVSRDTRVSAARPEQTH